MIKKRLFACVGTEGIEFLFIIKMVKNLIPFISSIKEAMTASISTYSVIYSEDIELLD